MKSFSFNVYYILPLNNDYIYHFLPIIMFMASNLKQLSSCFKLKLSSKFSELLKHIIVRVKVNTFRI